MSAKASNRISPGRVLAGRWQVESQIGQGAMGSVYRGLDLGTRDRDARVAIKILSPEHSRKTKALARFEREARLMTTLRHPNIVRLLGVGNEQSLPYLVMRFLEGHTLSAALKRNGGILPPVETLEVIRQLCSGLAYIHHHGLVHRDIKPQNIFLGPDGRVTILDLGVARDKSAPGLTKPGGLVGTPYYMSPEQILGAKELDRRTDVYALGAVIFEMLTGKPPFVAPSNFEILYAHRTLPPPDASLLSSFVPKPVAAVITRALAKNPDDRQQSVHELLADFEVNYALHSERTSPGISLAALEKQRPSRRPPSPAPAHLNPDTAIIELPHPSPELDTSDNSLPGMDTAEQTADASEGPAASAAQGELRVVTTVNGLTTTAQVFVNGIAQGGSPVSVSLSPGSYPIKVCRNGFKPVHRSAVVRANQITLFRLELEPNPNAQTG